MNPCLVSSNSMQSYAKVKKKCATSYLIEDMISKSILPFLPILPISKKYSIEGKTVLAFYIPSSPFKPVWYTSITNTFIRSGSED